VDRIDAQEAPLSVTAIDGVIVNLYPLADYGEHVGVTLGTGGQVNVALAGVPSLRLLGGLAYTHATSQNDAVHGFNDVRVVFGGGFEISGLGPVTVVPEVGLGWILHTVNGDLDDDGSDEVSVYVDQQLRITGRVIYPLSARLGISAAPAMVVFLEQEYLGLEIGLHLGVRYTLQENR